MASSWAVTASSNRSNSPSTRARPISKSARPGCSVSACQVGMSRGEMRVQRYRELAGRQSGGKFAAIDQHLAEIAMRGGERRIDGDGTAVARLGLAAPSGGKVGIAEIHMRVADVAGVVPDRFLDQLDGA